MYQLDEIKLLEAHESEVLCLEYSSVDNGRFHLLTAFICLKLGQIQTM